MRSFNRLWPRLRLAACASFLGLLLSACSFNSAGDEPVVADVTPSATDAGLADGTLGGDGQEGTDASPADASPSDASPIDVTGATADVPDGELFDSVNLDVGADGGADVGAKPGCVLDPATATGKLSAAQAQQVSTGLAHEMGHVAKTLRLFFEAYYVSSTKVCQAGFAANSGKVVLKATCSGDVATLTWSAASGGGATAFLIQATVPSLKAVTWDLTLLHMTVSDYHNGHGGWGDTGFGNSATGEGTCWRFRVSAAVTTTTSLKLTLVGRWKVVGSVPVPYSWVAMELTWSADALLHGTANVDGIAVTLK